MTVYGGTHTDAYEAVHMSNEEAMQWVDMNAPDKPLEERRAVAALFTRAALTRRAANLVDIEPTTVTPTYGPPDVEDDVFDPPPRDDALDGSEGVRAMGHTRDVGRGNASTQRSNDTVFNPGAYTSSKQAGR